MGYEIAQETVVEGSEGVVDIEDIGDAENNVAVEAAEAAEDTEATGAANDLPVALVAKTANALPVIVEVFHLNYLSLRRRGHRDADSLPIRVTQAALSQKGEEKVITVGSTAVAVAAASASLDIAAASAAGVVSAIALAVAANLDEDQMQPTSLAQAATETLVQTTTVKTPSLPRMMK